ncbi:SRPBCC family protein [Streptomyces poonensis]|uniref:SRPBCC family protein n=1 Tax=Streptomyces poonensis TaxID=68255 RepID=UPI00167A0297|nr:SRPBCC family protein [Streptomyces poonensis]
MALFALARVAPLSVDEAWRRLTDWERHADVVPLTRITVLTPPPTRAGTAFVGRTGVGPLAFDDPMEVVTWRPPTEDGTTALVRLDKRGRLITGWAQIEVHARGTGASQVVWREELSVRFLPPMFDRLLKWAGRWMFGRAVDGLLGTSQGHEPSPGIPG